MQIVLHVNTYAGPRRFLQALLTACRALGYSAIDVYAKLTGMNRYRRASRSRPVHCSRPPRVPPRPVAQSFEALGTRAAGNGRGLCRVADDASAVYWNPAGLAPAVAYFSLCCDRLQPGRTGPRARRLRDGSPAVEQASWPSARRRSACRTTGSRSTRVPPDRRPGDSQRRTARHPPCRRSRSCSPSSAVWPSAPP